MFARVPAVELFALWVYQGDVILNCNSNQVGLRLGQPSERATFTECTRNRHFQAYPNCKSFNILFFQVSSGFFLHRLIRHFN